MRQILEYVACFAMAAVMLSFAAASVALAYWIVRYFTKRDKK